MNERFELEDRILKMVSGQYEGIYQIDVEKNRVFLVDFSNQELGETKSIRLDNWIQEMVDNCHCEDRDSLLELISQAAISSYSNSGIKKVSRDIRFIVSRKYEWIHMTLMYDSHSRQITVTMRNVSHRFRYDEIIKKKNVELKKLLQTTEQYKNALMSESIVIYQVDFTRDVIENDMFQKKKNQLYNVLDTVGINTPCSYNEYCTRWRNRVSEDTIDTYKAFADSKKIIAAYNKGKTLLTQDYRTLDSQNEEMWIDKTIYLTKDNITGNIIGIVSLKNVTERYRQEYLRQSLEKQASMDLLTGLYNHVTGELLIKSKIDKSAYKYSAFIIFDIDKFKSVNDEHGHYFGDCVLQQVAKKLKECIREDYDIAIRYGGDEFVVYVEYKEGDNIEDIVSRIFKNVNCVYKNYNISVSMGISLSEDSNDYYYDMYKNADKALYEAKNSGRGCYKFYKDIIA